MMQTFSVLVVALTALLVSASPYHYKREAGGVSLCIPNHLVTSLSPQYPRGIPN